MIYVVCVRLAAVHFLAGKSVLVALSAGSGDVVFADLASKCGGKCCDPTTSLRMVGVIFV